MRLWFYATSYASTGEATDHGVVGASGVEWENRHDGFDEAVAAVLPELSEASTIKLEVTLGA